MTLMTLAMPTFFLCYNIVDPGVEAAWPGFQCWVFGFSVLLTLAQHCAGICQHDVLAWVRIDLICYYLIEM